MLSNLFFIFFTYYDILLLKLSSTWHNIFAWEGGSPDPSWILYHVRQELEKQLKKILNI
jgi:hypothetical protein